MNKPLISTLTLILFSIIAYAQKLPPVQLSSLRAPVNIKIDGKATEWDNKFQAYNNATDIFYTLSNDDDNLYLIVQSPDNDIINRIVGGGITLTIQKSVKKTDKSGVSVTYPIAKSLIFSLRGKKGVPPDTTASFLQTTMITNNKKLNEKCTMIGVTGIIGLDSLISVYNEDGIKAANKFDLKKVYTMEIAIALKHLGLSVNDAPKFAYQVRVNGAKGFGGMFVIPNPNATPEQLASQEKMTQSLNAFTAKLTSPTDFWGEYILAKK